VAWRFNGRGGQTTSMTRKRRAQRLLRFGGIADVLSRAPPNGSRRAYQVPREGRFTAKWLTPIGELQADLPGTNPAKW
jgi:hypothetical protein